MARKYTREATITAVNQGGGFHYASIRVADLGTGIPDAVSLARIVCAVLNNVNPAVEAYCVNGDVEPSDYRDEYPA